MKSSAKIGRDWDGKPLLRLRIYDSPNYDMDEDLRDQTFYQFILKIFPQPHLRSGIGWLCIHPRVSSSESTKGDSGVYEYDIYPTSLSETPAIIESMKTEFSNYFIADGPKSDKIAKTQKNKK